MAFGGETAESYYDEGVTASMKGDFRQAIAFFERAIQLDNTYAAAYHQLGKCYLRLGKAKKAVVFLTEVTHKKPGMTPAQVDLGYALLELGSIQEARNVFNGIVSLKPDHARAQLGLAYCAFREGLWEPAVLLAQTAINAGGAHFGALFLLGRAATLAGRIDIATETFKRAETLIEKSIETNPDAPEGYYLRGEVHFAQESFPNAIDNYRAAEERAQPDVRYSAYGESFTQLDTLVKRGLCYQRLGNVDAAHEVAEQILAVDPEHKIGLALKGAQ